MKARQSKVLEALGQPTLVTIPPQANNPPVSGGLADIAFGLAEDYGDFQNLAKLCYHPRSSSSDRVSQYIDQYGDVFTQELFKFFIENSKICHRRWNQGSHRESRDSQEYFLPR
jgi:hypothetical protein